MTEADVYIEGRTINTTFLILPYVNNYTLLGMDFIEKAKIVINVPQRTCYFTDDHVPYELKFERFDETINTLHLSYANALRGDEAQTNVKNSTNYYRKMKISSYQGKIQHHTPNTIDTENHAPVATPPYKISRLKKENLEKEIEAILKADIIEECESPWAA